MGHRGYKKVTISGGFHSAHPITVKINELGLIHVLYDNQIDWDKIDSWLPGRTRKKIEKHMCGHSDCFCGRRDWQIHISELAAKCARSRAAREQYQELKL